jgi:hypothetical protein
MNDHPIKAFFSIIAGLIAGSHSLLTSHPFQFISAVNYQAVIDLSIACFKAFLVGGAAWTGQTVAGYVRKKVIRWWRGRRDKNKAEI